MADPVPKIEFSVNGFDAEQMKANVPEYDSDVWLPKGIKYIENVEYKEEIFKAFPESFPSAFQRNSEINERMHMRLSKETESNPDAKICYLMVSHGATIDCMSTSFARFE